jgi:hypothetical protein
MITRTETRQNRNRTDTQKRQQNRKSSQNANENFPLLFPFRLNPEEGKRMENRNYVNSDYYAKLVRDKVKRETKVARMQGKLGSEPSRQPRNLCPKKPKKLTAEKLHVKFQAEGSSEPEKYRMRKNFSSSDNDLLYEIDDSLDVAKGFVFKKGNYRPESRVIVLFLRLSAPCMR